MSAAYAPADGRAILAASFGTVFGGVALHAVGMVDVPLAIATAVLGSILYTVGDLTRRDGRPRDGRWWRLALTGNLCFSALLACILAAVLTRFA
jgi:hypothetical protein